MPRWREVTSGETLMTETMSLQIIGSPFVSLPRIQFHLAIKPVSPGYLKGESRFRSQNLGAIRRMAQGTGHKEKSLLFLPYALRLTP